MLIKQSPLRKRLKEITYQPVSKHEGLLKEIQQDHSIDTISSEEYEGVKISEFMCFELAFCNLSLFNSEKYKGALEYQKGWKINPIGADKGFCRFMERNNSLEEIQLKDVKDGDLIIYYDNGQPTHAGQIINDRVRSKWGKGLLLVHKINEVPEHYGNTVRFFKPIPAEDCIELFIQYAKENRIPFQ